MTKGQRAPVDAAPPRSVVGRAECLSLVTAPHLRVSAAAALDTLVNGSRTGLPQHDPVPTRASATGARFRRSYPRAHIERMRRGGSGYLGYRVEITPRGDWRYFVAGD